MNTEKEKLSFVIVGLGSIGRRHLRNLLTLGIKDIILVRTGKSTLPEDSLPPLPQVFDLDEALKNEPTAVVVANPTSLHLPTALRAAEAGCNLFIEKPISHNLDDIDRLKALAVAKKIKIMVGYQFRFHPSLHQIHRWLSAGALGRPVSAQVNYAEYLPGWHPWEDYRQSYSGREELGGGVLLTLCHPFDYLQWLFGPIQSVFCRAERLSGLEINSEDIALTTLQFRQPFIATVYLDYICRPPRHDMHIIGQKGSIYWDALSGESKLFQETKEQPTIFLPENGFERNTMFVKEMEYFINCLLYDEQPIPSLADGIAVLQTVLAAKQSAINRKEMYVASDF